MRSSPVEKQFIVGIVGFASSLAIASIPSRGSALMLIPLFALAGVLTTIGLLAKRVMMVQFGLIFFAMASGGRCIAVLGIDQHNAGGNYAASVTWGWIMVFDLLLFDGVSERGIKW